jgi:DNA repair exonuclease SbcCD ATPase subunit
MEGIELLVENSVEDKEEGAVAIVIERAFVVNELVEYWEGAYVRGYRTDSGEPAWVKIDYGGGFYGIQMVGNTRGKVRRVQWTQLYKDGSFNTKKCMTRGGRVKTSARMRELARGEAEAKFGDDLRQTRRELQKSGKALEEVEKVSNERVQRQEVEARKAEKNQSAGHRRDLELMRDENRQGLQTLRQDGEDHDRQTRREIRQLRQELKALTEQLGIEKVGQADLHKQLLNEHKKRTRLSDVVETWKYKCVDQEKITGQREERIRNLDDDMREKKRAISTLEKLVERGAMSNAMEVDVMKHARVDLENKLKQRNEEVMQLEVERCEVRSRI